MIATRYLYLARHGEALPDESGLTDRGRRQAELLGDRLRDIPFTAVHHGPLPRAAQTAQLIASRLTAAPTPSAAEPAGDYPPYLPAEGDLPAEHAAVVTRVLEHYGSQELARGPELAREALARFTGPVAGGRDSYELLVTHNFLIGWLVRHAMDAPPWRWAGLNHGNAALTVIRYAPGRLASVLTYNDAGHLPEDLRWTGLPPELHP
ncbi:histidine phosphatase family protein [Kitasatospora camelliae]|uniref:Histidine phosphatase family protein n=1 Tax=Kitasatospora camelliae TaxID=3156397 RepID=A0AAU8K6F7_9ACTN